MIKTLLAQAQTGSEDGEAQLDKLVTGVLDALKADPPKKDDSTKKDGTDAPDIPSTLPGTTG